MSNRLEQLLENMTPQEKTEVEAFATFIIVRRKLCKPQILTTDISSDELMNLISESGSFDWLGSEKEDVYSIKNGSEVQWPTTS